MTRRAFTQFSFVRSARRVCLSAIGVLLLSSTVTAVPAIAPVAPSGRISRPDGDGSDGAKAVKEFLTKQHPQAGWVKGPAPIESEAIRQAYPNRKFYYVFSSSYPVARSGQISAVVGLGKMDAKPVLLRTSADFSTGLTAIKTEDDAKTAAAAVLSLVMTWLGVLAVTAEEITVKKIDEGGWQCTATRGVPAPRGGPGGIRVAPRGGIYFFADFDAEGNCTRAKIDDRNPRPICIGGLFLAVNLTQDVPADIGPERGGALLTASVEPDSIAAQAGLQPGDIIVSFGDEALPIDDTIQRMRQVVYPLKQQGNAERSITVLRDGRPVELTLRW